MQYIHIFAMPVKVGCDPKFKTFFKAEEYLVYCTELKKVELYKKSFCNRIPVQLEQPTITLNMWQKLYVS